MEIKKQIGILSGLIIMLSLGCSKQLPFEKLILNEPVGLDLKKYSSIKMDYDISLLEQFRIAEKEYNDTIGFELFLDTTFSFEKGTNMISITKFYSEDTKLDKVWNKLTSNRMSIENFRIYSKGLTNYLSRPAYFEHSACTISKKNTESISFLFRGDSTDFYAISIQVIKEVGYPKNMRELLFCAKSIKILS